jgi:hypothetical protein
MCQPGVFASGVVPFTAGCEFGAGDDAIMSIAGHFSRAMLSRYSHVGKEAKGRALDEITARQCAADEKRNAEAEQKQQVQVAAQSSVVH